MEIPTSTHGFTEVCTYIDITYKEIEFFVGLQINVDKERKKLKFSRNCIQKRFYNVLVVLIAQLCKQVFAIKSKFVENPSNAQWNGVNQVFRYLKGT